jgi:hypothetical protein
VPAEIRLPFSKAPAHQTADPGIWRKRVLPVGQIEYKGRVLTFDRKYLETLASSFSSQAYNQVPFQLADAANTHTNDPERFRGEILGVNVENDGLWVTMKPTPEGNKLLLTNPKLGVSARIVEDYARSDGKYFPAAIQHVLGTLDPRIPDLGAWEAVEMSNAPDMIIDLSAATFAGEEGGITMPELTTEQQAKLALLLDLPADRLSAAIDGLADITAAAGDAGGYNPVVPTEDDELVDAINGMTDEEFAELTAAYELDEEPALAGAGASLSNEGGYGMSEIELTNYQLAETQRQMGVLQRRADQEAFENEKRKLLGKGVPLYITDLARPLLEGTGHTVELANGDGVDAGLVMRRVLTEFGKAASMLDMSGELGSTMDEPDTSQRAEQTRDDIVSRYRNQVGI